MLGPFPGALLGPEVKFVETSAEVSSPDQMRNSLTEPFIPGSPQLVAPMASKDAVTFERSLVLVFVNF